MGLWDKIKEQATTAAEQMIENSGSSGGSVTANATPVKNSAPVPEAAPQTKPIAALAAKPAANPVAKPAANPVAKLAANPVAKLAANPVAKPAANPVAKPSASPVAEATKPSPPASKPPEPNPKPAQPSARPPVTNDSDDADTVVMATYPTRPAKRSADTAKPSAPKAPPVAAKASAPASPPAATKKTPPDDTSDMLDALLIPAAPRVPPTTAEVAATAANAIAGIFDDADVAEEAKKPAAADDEAEDDEADEAVDNDADDDEDDDDDDDDDDDEDDDEDLDGVDDFAGWDPNDAEGFWLKVYAIEEAGNQGKAQLEAAFSKHGLRNRRHFGQVRETFERNCADSEAFMQVAINARTKAMKQQMVDRMEGELSDELVPFEGVSLEQWAWLKAKIAGGGNLDELLVTAKMEKPQWDRVSAEWNARMERDTTATIATAYGQAFTASEPGSFAEVGQATAAAMLDPTKTGVDGEEPF